MIGHDVHRSRRLADHGLHVYPVSGVEPVLQQGDAGLGEHGRMERILPREGGRARMGAQAAVDRFEDYEPFERGTDIEPAALLSGGMAGKHAVHSVEKAVRDHILLARRVLHQSLPDKVLPVTEVDHFLCRREHHLQRALERLVLHGFDQGQGSGCLQAVAAGVDRSRSRFFRKAVHVCRYRNDGAAAAEGNRHARIADRFIGDAPAVQTGPDQPAGLEFPVSKLRDPEKPAAPVQDGGRISVDPAEDPLFLLARSHIHSRPVPVPTSSICISFPMAIFTLSAVQWQGYR